MMRLNIALTGFASACYKPRTETPLANTHRSAPWPI
jgi:hypothetical protein